MDSLIVIHHTIVPHVLHIDARDIVLVAIAPTDEQGVALFPGGVRHVVGGQRKLVGIAPKPSIGNLGGTLVCRPRGKGETEEETAKDLDADNSVNDYDYEVDYLSTIADLISNLSN